jgi:hypothetical protein
MKYIFILIMLRSVKEEVLQVSSTSVQGNVVDIEPGDGTHYKFVLLKNDQTNSGFVTVFGIGAKPLPMTDISIKQACTFVGSITVLMSLFSIHANTHPYLLYLTDKYGDKYAAWAAMLAVYHTYDNN